MARYKYKAFISYKHSASRLFAEKLEEGIKKYAKPLWQRPIPIFRDEKYLRPGIDLPGMIAAALLESEYFIYLASPEAAQSTWVQQEVEQWMGDQQRIPKVIIVLTDGRLIYHPINKEIDWERTNVLAPQFKVGLHRVPYFIDCREFRSIEQQSLSHPDFKKAVNAIVAALRNVDPLELDSEEVRQYRRNLMLLRSLFTSIVILAVSAAGLATFAWWQKSESDNNARIAHARQLEAQAELIRSTEPDSLGQALWLAAESMRLFPTPQAEETLRRIMDLSPRKKFSVYHSDTVFDVGYVEFSPDGRLLLSITDRDGAGVLGKGDKAVYVWDVKDSKVLYIFNHDDDVNAATFTPDSRYLVSGGDDLTARVWNLKDGRELIRVDHGDQPMTDTEYSYGLTSIIVSPDGRLVASTGRKRGLKIWELFSGKELYALHEKPKITNIIFSPNSSYVAMTDEVNGLRILDLKKLGTYRPWSLGRKLVPLGYFEGGERLLLSDERGNIKSLKIRSGQLHDELSSTEGLGEAVLTSDGRYLAAGDPTSIYIGIANVNALPKHRAWVWDLRAGKQLFESFDSKNVEALAISPDNRLLAVSRIWALHLWDIGSAKEVMRIAQGQRIGGVAFSPDGRLLATGGKRGAVWQIDTGMELAHFSHHGTSTPKASDVVYDIAFASEGRYLVSAGGDGTVRVWDVILAKEVGRIIHDGSVTCVAVSRDGRFGASSTDEGDIRVWQIPDGTEINRFRHPGEVWSIDLNPTGNLLVSGGFDRTVRLWNIETGTEVKRIDLDVYIGLVSFSANGRFFGAAMGHPSGSVGATAPIFGANEATIWDTQTGKQVFSAAHEFDGEPYLSYNSGVNDFAFSPDSRTLLTGSDDGTARIWEISTRRERLRVRHGGSVQAVGFTPLNDIVFSLAKEGLKLWHLSTGREVLHLASVTHRPIRFSRDGSLLLDGDGQVWDVTTGVLLARFLYGTGAHDIAWTPNDQMIATAVGNQIRIWGWNPHALLDEVCQRLDFQPSREEWLQFFHGQQYSPICFKGEHVQ